MREAGKRERIENREKNSRPYACRVTYSVQAQGEMCREEQCRQCGIEERGERERRGRDELSPQLLVNQRAALLECMCPGQLKGQAGIKNVLTDRMDALERPSSCG